MSFATVIARADHRWTFDGDVLDSIGSANGTATSIAFPATPICQGVTNSAQTNAVTDNITVPDQATINSAVLARSFIGGWIRISAKQGPPTCVFKIGGTSANKGVFCGVNNNNLVFQFDDGTENVQIYSDGIAVNNRNYHIGLKFDNGICTAYIDGVSQSTSDPDPADTGSANFPVHNGGIEWGNADSTVSVGGQTILLRALVNCFLNEWASWSGADIPTDTEIREDLFEEKAIATNVITSGTQAAMQLQVDALSGLSGNNVECDIEVQAVTGDGDVTLTLDNRTFDPLASLHIRYLGSGTLTIINTNGANASIATSNVSIENPQTLTINFTQSASEVRIYDDNGVSGASMGDELDGIESTAGTQFVFSHAGVTNDIIVQIIKDGFVEILFPFTIGGSNQVLNFTQSVAVNE